MIISKSDFMMYYRHPALLWIKKHNPKLIPPVDGATQAIFDAGNDFEQYAESQFPGGLTLGFEDFSEYETLPARTTAAIERGEKTLFQARFDKDGFT
ncbi:MAG: hypothetical protein LBQ11_01120, partial [Candidatus Nomurabacteria bacterium]|nr:hypothetical protein [Candidatus Nomurabacteria bacterium]